MVRGVGLGRVGVGGWVLHRPRWRSSSCTTMIYRICLVDEAGGTHVRAEVVFIGVSRLRYPSAKPSRYHFVRVAQ